MFLAGTLYSIAAGQSVPPKFTWLNPLVTDPGASNLTYKLYATTNLSLPTNQWTVTLLGPGFSNSPTTLSASSSFVYDNWFFFLSWTNTMWKKESSFSNMVVPDRLPSSTYQFNTSISPTP